MVVPERNKEALAMLALHEALRNVCLNYDWTYAVFWTIRPRPRCRGGANSKAGEDNGSLMLMWEDGFCQVDGSQRNSGGSTTLLSRIRRRRASALYSENSEAHSEEADGEPPIWTAFRKMSVQLYNYGEGLMGKVASDKCHKWVLKESPECELVGISSYWQTSFDAHPPEWTHQFEAGIQTIAVIQAGRGLLQLGSCRVVAEDLHFVLRMRHTFESLEYPSAIFVAQPFATTAATVAVGARNGAPNAYPSSFLTPPPSPHSWSLCTVPTLESSRFRGTGLHKETGTENPATEKINEEMLQNPKVSRNAGSSMTLDTSSSLRKKQEGQAAFPDTVWTDASPYHSLMNTSPVARKGDGNLIQDLQNRHHDHLLAASDLHVASPTSSKLYQRRSSLPKVHPVLPFSSPSTSISSIEAPLGGQRIQRPDMPTSGDFLRQFPARYPKDHETVPPISIDNQFFAVSAENQERCMEMLNAPEKSTREEAACAHNFSFDKGSPTASTMKGCSYTTSLPSFPCHPQFSRAQAVYSDKQTRNEQVCSVDYSNLPSLTANQHHAEGDFYSEMMEAGFHEG